MYMVFSDLYRRAMEFDKARELLMVHSFSDNLLNKIKNFELELICKRDAECHNLREIAID